MAPKDPILGVTETYNSDPNPKKVNLGVGIPTMCSNTDIGETDIVYHSENGVIGYGPVAAEDVAGLIDAGMSGPIYADPQIRALREARVPLGRLGRADDIARAVLWLLSDASEYITGEEILVDGGKGQLAVAVEVVNELGLQDVVPVAALAKRLEEVFVPGRDEAVEFERGSEALFMLQHIRDEAHRFANSFHRKLRAKAMVASPLDGVAGLGPARKKRLVSHFGSLNALQGASLEDLQALTWLPDDVAARVHHALHR